MLHQNTEPTASKIVRTITLHMNVRLHAAVNLQTYMNQQKSATGELNSRWAAMPHFPTSRQNLPTYHNRMETRYCACTTTIAVQKLYFEKYSYACSNMNNSMRVPVLSYFLLTWASKGGFLRIPKKFALHQLWPHHTSAFDLVFVLAANMEPSAGWPVYMAPRAVFGRPWLSFFPPQAEVFPESLWLLQQFLHSTR